MHLLPIRTQVLQMTLQVATHLSKFRAIILFILILVIQPPKGKQTLELDPMIN